MGKQSAGLLLHRRRQASVEILLVHPGGPFWAKKDAGSWSIPKGEFDAAEDPKAAARREFTEELGSAAPTGDLVELGSAKLTSGKVIFAWGVEADFDVVTFHSNAFEMEWPPKSGKQQEFPEVDKVAWFSVEMAQAKLHKGQLPLLQALIDHLGIVPDKPKPIPEQTGLF